MRLDGSYINMIMIIFHSEVGTHTVEAMLKHGSLDAGERCSRKEIIVGDAVLIRRILRSFVCPAGLGRRMERTTARKAIILLMLRP